jgi:hypothetical protein
VKPFDFAAAIASKMAKDGRCHAWHSAYFEHDFAF